MEQNSSTFRGYTIKISCSSFLIIKSCLSCLGQQTWVLRERVINNKVGWSVLLLWKMWVYHKAAPQTNISTRNKKHLRQLKEPWVQSWRWQVDNFSKEEPVPQLYTYVNDQFSGTFLSSKFIATWTIKQPLIRYANFQWFISWYRNPIGSINS